jgi:hypothetical protein
MVGTSCGYQIRNTVLVYYEMTLVDRVVRSSGEGPSCRIHWIVDERCLQV